MDFEHSDLSMRMQAEITAFMSKLVMPRQAEWTRLTEEEGVFPPPFLEDLKAEAKSRGLWNLFMPNFPQGAPGTRMSNLDYAPCAEIMGRVLWASEVFNCSPGDTGNMELLEVGGTPALKEQWLTPLLEGKIRSSFAMTEKEVASSDATNIQTRIERVGGDYVINGRKWFISGAADPRCAVYIVMGQTEPSHPEKHRRQSMVVVQAGTPGLTVVRNPKILQHTSPQGHCEVLFENVRVPVSNLLGEEGGGFALAQARLGPGRVHHCMRSIGQCELAIELMVERAQKRTTFGHTLNEHGVVAEWIALSRLELEQARLLVLKAAWAMDRFSNKGARNDIAYIKVAVSRTQTRIADRAMQVFGGAGLTQDVPLFDIWSRGRLLQIVDGPDEVHLQSISRSEIRRQNKARETQAAALMPAQAAQ